MNGFLELVFDLVQDDGLEWVSASIASMTEFRFLTPPFVISLAAIIAPTLATHGSHAWW
jgi:hypothetical protein